MRMILICLALYFITIPAMAKDTTPALKNFEYDGCTMFVEGPTSNPNLWDHCCFEHDLRYWFGGTRTNKDFSDLELKACVKDVAGNFWANIIYNGVKSGGKSPFKHKFRWSWAWEPERKNIELTSSEIQYIMERLNDVELEPKFREEFIKKYLKN